MDSDKAGFNYEQTVEGLNVFYRRVKQQILRYQSLTTGLYPYDQLHKPNEAHVRDSVYCAAATWALGQAYKRIDDDQGRTYELEQASVKTMRGVLKCWITQIDKVEKFKQNQSPKSALHSKFHIITGEALPDEYDHLQIDCIALYLIFLVQMIQTGLQIIFTTDEVNFIQNLVFYVERAYRTPDFGMWERGSKYNIGASELNASSIGMAKAALEAVNGVNMFGESGANWSVIFIDIDAHYRNRTNFDTLLPRESASKNTDASLIPTVSWPVFAIHEESLVNRTMDKVIRKLKGKYGFKRFLRDGYGTVLEDTTRKYYHQAEVKVFDDIECEWPIFVAYMVIDSIYKNDSVKVDYWQLKLKSLLVTHPKSKDPILPKYYYVDGCHIEDERAKPGSTKRLPNCQNEEDSIFLWGQSVYLISQLLVSGLLHKHDIDPTRRYLPASVRPRLSSRYSCFQSSPSDLVIQVVLISESVHLQQQLATYGIQTQTPHQIEPIQIWPPSELVKAYEQLGVNNKLGLTGRPPRPIGGLGTAKLYRACGLTFLCYPLLFEMSDFYTSQDMEFVLEDIKSDLRFLGKCWKLAGRPTFCMMIREDNMAGHNARFLFELLSQFKMGVCDGIKVRLGRMQEFVMTSCIEHLDFLHLDSDEDHTFKPIIEKDVGQQFHSLTDIPKSTSLSQQREGWVDFETLQCKSNWDLEQMVLSGAVDNMYMMCQLLQVLLTREGRLHCIGQDGMNVEDRLEHLIHTAGNKQLWAVVRFASSLLGRLVDSIAPSITAILVRGKQVTVGVYSHDEVVIDKPVSPNEIKSLLYSTCFPHSVIQAVLQQELIIDIGKFLTTDPAIFNGILKIRIGWIIQAMDLELSFASEKRSKSDKPVPGDDDMPDLTLTSMSPSNIKKLLYRTLKEHPKDRDYRSVIWNRQLNGALNRVPDDFYDKVWAILERTPAGLKCAGYHLPQQPTLSDMTQYELNFSLLVELMLSKINDPAYRQVIVEAFMCVATILDRNKELSFSHTVDMDKIMQQAFTDFQKDYAKKHSGDGGKDDHENMQLFYSTEANKTGGTTTFIARAIVDQLLDGKLNDINAKCVLM